MADQSKNKANAILAAARQQHYGVPAVCVYNLEGIMATVRAAEAKRSPAMILLFPWALEYCSSSSSSSSSSSEATHSGTALVQCAANAARDANVPISVHLDHAQDPAAVRAAADMLMLDTTTTSSSSTSSTSAPSSTDAGGAQAGTTHPRTRPCFDSIMIDMSHYDHAENLSLTRDLTRYCHARGIAVEAESGRIEGGEDGVSDTADLQGLMTSPDQAREFVEQGIDWLAPAFGNVHGLYGERGIQLDLDRLRGIREGISGVNSDGGVQSDDGAKQVQLVLHGTDGFTKEIYQSCIQQGITKCNINRVVNDALVKVWEGGSGKRTVTGVIQEGTKAMQAEIEILMDWLGSAGKA